VLCDAKYIALPTEFLEGAMHIHEALERLDQIHEQLTKSEVYVGFRVPAVVAVGLLGFLAAAFQPLVPFLDYVSYWMTVAAVCAVIGTAAALHSYASREDEFARRRTRRVMAQFLPCLIAGGAVTAALARVPELTAFLPGLWAVVFGLGVIAARPHLPRTIEWVGIGYIVAGSAIALRSSVGGEPSPWTVGGVFGMGHLATAFVLWRGTATTTEDGTDA
jgi:hypothetical protein